MTMQEVNGSLKQFGFWTFNIGHLLICIGLIAAFLAWWANFGSLPQRNAENIRQLAEIVKDINEHGPVWGRINMQANSSDIHSLDVRITRLEASYASVNEKLTSVQTKLDVIAALLEDSKKAKK
jgi:hypothetical protein